MDLISREALIDSLEKEQEIYENSGAIPCFWTALSVVIHAPTVEVIPVVHGKWILEEKAGIDYWCCSECHKIKSEYYAKPKDNFCGNCGASMRTSVE